MTNIEDIIQKACFTSLGGEPEIQHRQFMAQCCDKLAADARRTGELVDARIYTKQADTNSAIANLAIRALQTQNN